MCADSVCAAMVYCSLCSWNNVLQFQPFVNMDKCSIFLPHVCVLSSHIKTILFPTTTFKFKARTAGLQERRSNLHSVKCQSTEWRFEWLISPLNI